MADVLKCYMVSLPNHHCPSTILLYGDYDWNKDLIDNSCVFSDFLVKMMVSASMIIIQIVCKPLAASGRAFAPWLMRVYDAKRQFNVTVAFQVSIKSPFCVQCFDAVDWAWLYVCGEVQIGPADATATHCLAPVNPDCFYLPGFTFLVPAHPGSSGHSPWGRKTVVVVVVVVMRTCIDISKLLWQNFSLSSSSLTNSNSCFLPAVFVLSLQPAVAVSSPVVERLRHITGEFVCFMYWWFSSVLVKRLAGKASQKWPVLCRAGRKTLTRLINCLLISRLELSTIVSIQFENLLNT